MPGLTLDWFHVIDLLGAVQGVFLAGALASRRHNRTASRLLAATMLAFSIALATVVYHGARLELHFPHFFGVAYPLPLLYGPLVYLYAVTAADRTRRLGWRDALHFVPFAFVVVAELPVLLSSGAEKLAFYHRLLAGDQPPLVTIVDPLKMVLGVVYTVFTILFLRRHRERVKDSYSSVERVGLRWLLLLGAATAGIWGLAVVFDVLESAGIARIGRGDDLVSLAMAALVYAIGYMGLRQPEVFRYETAEYPIPQGATRSAVEKAAPAAVAMSTVAPVAMVTTPTPMLAPVTETVPEPDVESAAPRYERSGLTERQASRLKDALMVLMEKDRPWQDSELTLADLAERLATTPHKLSEVLNAQLGQTFYDFVNGYRVREVQRRIMAGEARSRAMLTLALDAGFASKSTFNLVFKKHTGQTPSDFRQGAGV